MFITLRSEVLTKKRKRAGEYFILQKCVFGTIICLRVQSCDIIKVLSASRALHSRAIRCPSIILQRRGWEEEEEKFVLIGSSWIHHESNFVILPLSSRSSRSTLNKFPC